LLFSVSPEKTPPDLIKINTQLERQTFGRLASGDRKILQERRAAPI